MIRVERIVISRGAALWWLVHIARARTFLHSRTVRRAPITTLTVTNVCKMEAGRSPLMSSTVLHPLEAPGGSSRESSLSSPLGTAASSSASSSAPPAGVAVLLLLLSSFEGTGMPPRAAGEASTAGS